MQRIVKNLIFILVTALLLVSCNDGASLQRYYVDNQETPNFTSIDLPVSILKMDESKLTDNQKEAYSSVKRLNFLGYRLDENNLAAFNTELAKVKTILKDKKYNDLMEFNDKNAFKKSILQLYSHFKDGELMVNSNNLNQYHRKELTKKVSEIIVEITA